MALKRYVLWLWLLSGAPIGLALMWMPPLGRIVLLTIFLLLETAHVLSPILLAWMHAGFRRIMLNQPRKYLVFPSAVFAVAAGVSIATAVGWTAYNPATGPLTPHATGWDNPFPILFAVYFVWNFYHFSMQNYGVLRLAGADLGRWGKPIAFVGTALSLHVMPLAVSANHWITDIGLSWRVSRHKWWFVLILLALAPLVFLWSPLPTSEGMSLRRMEGIVIALSGIRGLGVSFVHFLYSRWIWKLSDPQVRATVGRDLLSVPRSCT